MGLPSTNSAKPITLLGGLTSFGGAGNNYSMHASASLYTSIIEQRDIQLLTCMLQSLTAMVRRLRTRHDRNGLILANGGVLTYQHALCLSTRPRRRGSAYPNMNPLPSHVTEIPVPKVTIHAEGEAVIEVSLSSASPLCLNIAFTPVDQTYTVEYNRENMPAKGFVVGRLTSNNERFIANTGNIKTLEQLSSREIEPIGRIGRVRRSEDGRNLFWFEENAKL